MAQRPPGLARLMASIQLMEGCKVEIQVNTGVVYEGIWSIGNVEGEQAGVLLKFPRVIREPNLQTDKNKTVQKLKKSLNVPMRDIIQVIARDVSIHPDDMAGPDEFDTDANISKSRAGGFGRELQPWMPDPSADHGMMLTLEESGTGWDQFAVNEQKFGVRTTYDEHLYTTKIDRANCGISEAQASRIAKEIMQDSLTKGGLADYHMAEERGFEIDDKMDEEDRYGAVMREVPMPGQQGSSRRTSGQQDTGQQQGPRAQPAARAWGNMGAGVAAVAGRTTTASSSSSGGGSSVNGAATAPPAVPMAAPAVVGGLSQNFAAVAAGSAGRGAGPPVPGRASNAASWSSAALQPSGDMALRQAKGRTQGTAAMPIRSGKHATELDGFGHATDALALALPGPSSTPPDIKFAFGKFKADQAAKARDAEAQRALTQFKSIQPSKSPGSGAGSQPSPSTSLSAVTPIAALPSAALAAQLGVSLAAPGTATAGFAPGVPAPSTTATPASDDTSETKPLATAVSKGTGLNPFAKEWVPPGAGTPPAAAAPATATVTSIQPPPPPSMPPATSSFGSKNNSASGVYTAGPHAIPMHTMGMHGGPGHMGVVLQHGHHAGDVHHSGGPGTHVVAVPGQLQSSGDSMNMHHTGMHAPGHAPGIRMTHGAGPGLQDGHLPIPTSGPHAHGIPMTMPPGGMAGTAMQPMTATGNPLPFVMPQSLGIAGGQPMAMNPGTPGSVIQAHPMMGGHQVMFQPGAQGPHGVRPGSMQASGAQQVPMGVAMMPAGGMGPHAGYGYMQGAPHPGYALVQGGPGSMPGTMPMAHGGAMPMQMSGAGGMSQGQQHGGDMGHMGRGPGAPGGMMKGMGMGPGRGGGRGAMMQQGRGMGHHNHGNMGE